MYHGLEQIEEAGNGGAAHTGRTSIESPLVLSSERTISVTQEALLVLPFIGSPMTSAHAGGAIAVKFSTA